MTQPTHRWAILGVSRFTPAPNAASYISCVNWTLFTRLGERTAARTSFTTFGPDHPGSADLNLDELVALIRDPSVEAELEAELGHAPGEPEPEAQTTEIRVVEEAVDSTDTPAPEEPPVICVIEPPATPAPATKRLSLIHI